MHRSEENMDLYAKEMGVSATEVKDDISTETVIIVAGCCSAVIIALLITLIVLCCRKCRLQDKASAKENLEFEENVTSHLAKQRSRQPPAMVPIVPTGVSPDSLTTIPGVSAHASAVMEMLAMRERPQPIGSVRQIPAVTSHEDGARSYPGSPRQTIHRPQPVNPHLLHSTPSLFQGHLQSGHLSNYDHHQGPTQSDYPFQYHTIDRSGNTATHFHDHTPMTSHGHIHVRSTSDLTGQPEARQREEEHFMANGLLMTPNTRKKIFYEVVV